MRYNFLYTRSRNTVGYLDAHESLEDSLWFMSDEHSHLIDWFSKCSIEQYLITLVEIFRNGDPNYSRLGEILGHDTNVEDNLFVISEVNREKEDIEKLTFSLVDYKIASLYLHLQKPTFSFASLRNELASQKDVSLFENSETITIGINDVTVVVGSI